MPVLHPAEIWQQSGRWYDVGLSFPLQGPQPERLRLGDDPREVITDLARREINSYRQLPSWPTTSR